MFRMNDASLQDQELRRLHGAVTGLAEAVNVIVAALAAGRVGSATDDRIAEIAPVTEFLTPDQRSVCERVINVYETGTVRGKYGAISLYHDGPHRIQQITYGRSQTTEYGNLRELVQMYAAAGGLYSDNLAPFVPRIGRVALTDDKTFIGLLKRAGSEDPVMRDTQDRFFDRRYFTPAITWAAARGFALPLSALVIYDSFIHSGGIPDFLRSRFTARPPAQSGDERVWVRDYVDVRHRWLTTHSNPDLRPSNYRTRDLLREIASGNWQLDRLPFMANGVPVNAREDGASAVAAMYNGLDADVDDIPYLGAVPSNAYVEDDDEVLCESEPAADDFAIGVVGDTAAALAGRILESGRIELAATHPSGVVDDAGARRNVQDTAAGQAAARSTYGNAPGGTVRLDPRMLEGMCALAGHFSFSVSELAGGSHSPSSRHYAGIAFDVAAINGRRVRADHPDAAAFKALCSKLGASEVLGPGDRGHDTHVHAAWSRT